MLPSFIPYRCALKLLDVKPYTPTSFVGVTVIDYTLNERYDLGNVFGYSGDGIWRKDVEAGHVFEELGFPVGC
jgi:hypothetical protein